MKTKHQLERNLLSYKDERKNNELLAKLKVVRDVLEKKHPKTSVSAKYNMHRNTVTNLCHNFCQRVPIEAQTILLQKRPPPLAVIQELMAPLGSDSTKPHSNSRMASEEQTEAVKKLFCEDKLAVGYKRMYRLIRRKLDSYDPNSNLACLSTLSFAMLKGIYRRENLKVRKVRTRHGEIRPLYDYPAIACFEYLHYDTKDIADQKALPKPVYELFKNNPSLPQVEWNIIDARSRFRFMAYSHNRSSEFGLHFFLFVICFLRLFNIRVGEKITIGMDNGAEFTSGSKEKLDNWNRVLALLQAEAYCYSPGHDVRKNLIERSHLTDDQEFLVPRGKFIHDKHSFLKEARAYTTYYNYLRPHSGREMNDKTPFELLQAKGIHQANSLLKFPVMLLEHSITQIKSATQWLLMQSVCQEAPLHDQRFYADLSATFPDLGINAQNVLTPYLMELAGSRYPWLFGLAS